MFPAALYYGDITQLAFVVVSFVLVLISVNAYRRRPEGRYLFLALAFIFLCAVASNTAFFELYTGGEPIVTQLAVLYLNPSLEILMVVCFLLAVVWSRAARKRVIVTVLVATVIIGAAASLSYETGNLNGFNAGVQSSLPPGCVRPNGGFLIIASSMGYNDSIAHGAPSVSWPVLDIAVGTNVSIAVCNAYTLPVGFQVTHYLDDRLVSIAPWHTIVVNFLADQVGVFFIYCSIFNPIHIYLQGGKVVVS